VIYRKNDIFLNEVSVKPIEVREIQHGTSEYQNEIDLRDRILRKPLGLRFAQEDLLKESQDFHLGAFREDQLVGCLVLTPDNEGKIKMRQVAVDDSAQGLGVGRMLVEASEIKARSLGFSEMLLHARNTAVPFYLKLGYEVFGDPFVEVTVPHRKMRKRL
jgi:predicted GNAT family N-acyltransferase